jgi:PKD repeat protein
MAETTPAIASYDWSDEVRDWDHLTDSLDPGGKHIVPEFVYTDGHSYKVLVSTGESGKERRRAKRSTNKKTWQLTFNSYSEKEISRIFDFFDYCVGPTNSFTFTCPRNDVSYTVRFTDDSLGRSWQSESIHQVTINFIQVL